MNHINGALVVSAVILSCCLTSDVWASEPVIQAESAAAPAELPSPLPQPKNTCADWPYCIISLLALA